MNLTPEQIALLLSPLPNGSVKPDTRSGKEGMSSIATYAPHKRLQEVFGIGGYRTESEVIRLDTYSQTVLRGKPNQYDREMFRASVKVTLYIGEWKQEYYGGSQSDDMGDALKGAATDALTTLCAMYLGIGRYIWEGGKHGSTPPPPPAPVAPPAAPKKTVIASPDEVLAKPGATITESTKQAGMWKFEWPDAVAGVTTDIKLMYEARYVANNSPTPAEQYLHDNQENLWK